MTSRSLAYSPTLHWILRIGAFMCYVGHGAFGVQTKQGWLPFFHALGIHDDALALRLMPIVGTNDIIMGLFVLLSPCRIVLAWMTVWAVFTAFLRPMAGQGYWEVLERAGNYGIPFAFLVLSGWARSWREWFEPIVPRPSPEPDAARMAKVALILRVATSMLLIGHAGYGAFMHKQMLADQYAAVGFGGFPGGAAALVPTIGWFEMALGIAVLLAPLPPLLLFIFLWKVGTELLYPVAGIGQTPIFEWVERGGSYAAPLALFVLTVRRSVPSLARRDPRMAVSQRTA